MLAQAFSHLLTPPTITPATSHSQGPCWCLSQNAVRTLKEQKFEYQMRFKKQEEIYQSSKSNFSSSDEAENLLQRR